jgi:DNA-binding CsgD family transcriptional regulator
MNLRGGPWLKRIVSATSLMDLKESLGKVVGRLGFEYYFYRSHLPHLPEWLREVCVDNAPASWHRHCLRKGLDGTFEALRRIAEQRTTPVLWREVGPYHRELLATAREFGFLTGVTQLVHGPGGQWTSISFIKNRSGPAAEREIVAVLPQCQLLTCYVHDAAKNLVRHRFGSGILLRASAALPDSGLSKRERDCLMWAAIGKTTSEIAEILPISERTVIFHLANARQKLGAANSRQAISKAVSLGIIAGN